MKYKLIRQIEGKELEVGSFSIKGDALWAATMFQSHKIFGVNIHFVKSGKKVFVPAGAIDAQQFNTV